MSIRLSVAFACLHPDIFDRNDLKAWHNGDALVAAVAAVNKNTVVVVHSVGQIIMEPWIDHANGECECSLRIC